MKRFIILISLVIISHSANCAIRRDTIPHIHFQLIDAVNGNPVPLAHAMNLTQKIGVISDMLGYFRLPVNLEDTLLISALGYHDMRIPSWGQFSADSMYYPVRLTPRIYEIREVRITRFGSYQRFLKEVAAMDLPKSEQEIMQEKIEEYFKKAIKQLDLKDLPQTTSGFVFGKDWFTLQREKIEIKRHEEIKWDIILKKFSVEIIGEITGLKGVDAIRFMEFCDFTEGYLLTVSEYEVRRRLLDFYEEYKKTNPKVNLNTRK